MTKSSFGSFGNKVSNFSFIPPGHFGLKNEEDLPPQNRVDGSANFTSAILPFGTVGNIGNLNVTKSKTWKQGLAIAIANRYTAAAFCSWYATAGSIPGLLGRVRLLRLPTAHQLTLVAAARRGAQRYQSHQQYGRQHV